MQPSFKLNHSNTILNELAFKLKNSTSPRLDAELLLMVVLNISRAKLFSHSEIISNLNSEQHDKLNHLIERRNNGEPIAYLLGHQPFWSLDLIVDSNVLVPRPETEMLVEWGLNHLDHSELHIADIGTGSGAIAITLAHERPNWKIDAVDDSEAALNIARTNAEKYSANNIVFYLGDLCSALPKKNYYHAIFSNPPYLSKEDPHLLNLKYEPESALVSGEKGLDAIQKIISEASSYLVNSGWLILEHGFDQKNAVITLLQESGYQNIQDYLDLSHIPRMVVAQKNFS